jgi:uridine kinase
MNLRVFIDSDSDVRCSRRIYKDTVENFKHLDVSILEYLTKIKPSYEKEIEPTKVDCDLVVPHIGNGYADHKMKNRSNVDINIRNITNLLINQVRTAVKSYKELE